MSKRVIFIEHDHVSAGGPIWKQFEKRGYEISRFIIVDEEHAKTPNVTPDWPDLLSFDVVVVMGAPYAAYDDGAIGNWLIPQVAKNYVILYRFLSKCLFILIVKEFFL